MTKYDTTMTVLENNTTDSWEVPHFSDHEEGLENNDEYLDALATGQEDKAEALAQTKHYVKLETKSIRYECHVVIFLNNSYNEIVTTRDQNGSASSATVHTGHHSALKNKWNQVRGRRDCTCSVRRIFCGNAHRNEHVREESTGNRKSLD